MSRDPNEYNIDKSKIVYLKHTASRLFACPYFWTEREQNKARLMGRYPQPAGGGKRIKKKQKGKTKKERKKLERKKTRKSKR